MLDTSQTCRHAGLHALVRHGSVARVGTPLANMVTVLQKRKDVYVRAHPPFYLVCVQVYLSVDALVNRGSLDLIGALLEANSVLESLSPEGQKARKARQQAELQAAGAGQFRQITR